MLNRKSPPRSRSLVFRALLSFAPVIIPSAARLRASDATKPKRQIIGSYARQELDGLFCLRVKICHRNHTRSPTIRVRFCASKYFWQGSERERRVKKLPGVPLAPHAATKTCSDIAHANIRTVPPPPPQSRRRWRWPQRQRQQRWRTTAENEVTDTASRSLTATSVCHFSERDRRDRSIARLINTMPQKKSPDCSRQEMYPERDGSFLPERPFNCKVHPSPSHAPSLTHID